MAPVPTPTATIPASAALSPIPTAGVIDDYQQAQYNHNIDIPKSIPIRVSKAIPIVAPPAAAPVSNNRTSSTINVTNGLSTDNKAIIESVMKAMDGKQIHEKKQLLGDRLFPLVKATGTKQAPKVTIALLDNVDLLELATMMFDKDALKKQVDITFNAVKQQQQQQQ
jgi:hypothetical protein